MIDINVQLKDNSGNNLMPKNIKYEEVVLYNNITGTTGNVTLSETSANFSYIEIFYKFTSWSSNVYDSVKIYQPNGKRVNLNPTYFQSTGSMQLGMGALNISGTSITWLKNITTTLNSTVTGANKMYITRVVGYR